MNKKNTAEKKQTRESVQRGSATRRKEVTKSGTSSAKGKARASSVKSKTRNLLENANEDLSITEYENDKNEDFSFLSGDQKLENPLKVYSIDLSGKKLKTIVGIEKYPNCKCLDLSCNQIEEIKNLDKNVDICELKLYSNEISCLQGLERLRKLQNLQLQHNQIKKVGNGLKDLQNLKILRLGSNKLEFLEAQELKSCTNLTYLDLSNNNLKNLNCLKALPSLEELYVAFNKLEVCPDASVCKKLHEIDLSNNFLSDVTGIKNLPKLTVLNLSCNKISNLRSLSSSKSIQQLDISENAITELLHTTQQFPNLEVLAAANNRISNWKEVIHLSGLKELKELYLDGNPVKKQIKDSSNWNRKIVETLPRLEIIDGVHLTRLQSRSGEPRPMRPMTASQQGVSAKLVQAQLNVIDHELEFYKDLISSKFTSVKDLLVTLPEKSPVSASDKDKQNIEVQVKREEKELIRSRPSTAGSNYRPTSRCGSRARIQDALAFASKHMEEHEMKETKYTLDPNPTSGN